MRELTAQDVVTLWEQGRGRHAIDRALLLFAAACPELPPEHLADLPLGQRNEALFRLRERTFGPNIRTYADCPACGGRNEAMLHTQPFLAAAAEHARNEQFETRGYRFRAPTSRDLSAVVSCNDATSATIRLLERCCVACPSGAAVDATALLDDVEAGLGALDPIADIELSLACEACGRPWTAPFDIAGVLWDELDAKARALFGEVHVLASAYGWREQDILALGEARRAAYLAMVGGP